MSRSISSPSLIRVRYGGHRNNPLDIRTTRKRASRSSSCFILLRYLAGRFGIFMAINGSKIPYLRLLCGMCYEGSGDMSWAVLLWTTRITGPMESLNPSSFSACLQISTCSSEDKVHCRMKELRASMHYVAWNTDAGVKSRLRILTTRSYRRQARPE